MIQLPTCLTHLAVPVLQAGKFSIIPTVINIGSGLALMSAVSTPLPPSGLASFLERGKQLLGRSMLNPEHRRPVKSKGQGSFHTLPAAPGGTDCLL